MRLFDAARTRVRGLFRRGRIERELDAELTFHLEQQIAENVAAGMRPDDARRAALQAVGRPNAIKDVYREMHRLPVVETLWRDVRYAARGLGRAPLFSLVAVVTLALGIGANTLIFSVLNGVVLRTVPYPDADRLMLLQITASVPGRGTSAAPWSYPKFEDLRAHANAFSSIEGFVPRDVNLAGVGEAERVKSEIVTGGYFSMLGVPAIFGRTLEPEDDRTGDPRAVAVISERLWDRMFARDPAIIGRSVHVNRELVTIVGVAPADFRGESGSAELWVPVVVLAPALMNTPRRLQMRNANWLTVVARVKADVTTAQADADVKTVVRHMEDALPSTAFPGRPSPTWSGIATPLTEAKVDPMLRRSLLILLGAVAFVLLITCLNLASLMLSRAISRQRETAVRLAIGAGRAALVRHILTESVLLGLLGGLFGVFVAALGVRALAFVASGQVGSAAPFVRRLTIDWIDVQHPATLAFAFVLAVIAGLLFGALPAAHTTRVDLAHAMKSSGTSWMRGGHGIRRLNIRSTLLVAQFALAIVLLVGAGLMLRSLSRVWSIHLGFEPHQVLTLRLDPPPAHYDDNARRILHDDITERVRPLPGVEAVAIASTLPVRGQNEATSFQIDGVPQVGEIGVHMVGPDYFSALRVPLIKGRLLREDDSASAPRVALINETFARRQWPGENPIGQRLSLAVTGWGEPGQEATIVGVVGDVKYQLLETPVGFDAYLSYRQRPPIATSLVIRTSSDPTSLVEPIRQQLARVDRTLPAFDVMLMAEVARDASARWRFSGVLLTAFAALAMILTAAGIYGMLVSSVVARTREIGVRMALGAERVGIVRLVFLDACTICAIGLAVGVPSAAVLARFMRSLLYGVEPADPGTLATVAALAVLTALLAALQPAWKATRIDPLSALRQE